MLIWPIFGFISIKEMKKIYTLLFKWQKMYIDWLIPRGVELIGRYFAYGASYCTAE